MWRMSGRGEMAREDDFGVQASPVARKRPVGQTQSGALLTSPPWGASGQPRNVAARPRIVRGRVPSTRERGVCTPLTDTPEHGPASPSSLRDAPRAGARFAQGNGVHAVGHAGDFLMIFLKKKKSHVRVENEGMGRPHTALPVRLLVLCAIAEFHVRPAAGLVGFFGRLLATQSSAGPSHVSACVFSVSGKRSLFVELITRDQIRSNRVDTVWNCNWFL